jgi:hypothetical protein
MLCVGRFPALPPFTETLRPCTSPWHLIETTTHPLSVMPRPFVFVLQVFLRTHALTNSRGSAGVHLEIGTCLIDIASAASSPSITHSCGADAAIAVGLMQPLLL